MPDNPFSAFRLVKGDVAEMNREVDQITLGFTRVANVLADLERRIAQLEFEQGPIGPRP